MQVVTATILNNGKALKATYRIIGIDINREVNRIPYAQVLLVDGHSASRTFPLSDDDFFAPGEDIEIKLRFEGSTSSAKTVFKGMVIRHALESDGQESVLRIELIDEAYRMTTVRNSTVHKGTDKAIFQKLINNSKLEIGKIPSTSPEHKELVQYYATDWDFMLMRAEAQNLVVAVHDGNISMANPKIPASAKHVFDYGIDLLYNLSIETDAGSQYKEVVSSAWDAKKNEMTKPKEISSFNLDQGDSPAEMAKKMGSTTFHIKTTVPMHPDEIENWANGRLMKSRLSMVRGSVTMVGDGSVQLLDGMELKGVGKRFKGKTLVTGIRHQVDENGWQTHLQFGLPAEPFHQSPDILDAPAGGLLPGVHGLQPGIVEAFKEDPEKQFRIQVRLPGIDPKKGVIWARIAMPEAGKERGHLYLPEKGDEVVVGFFNDDPRQPVILGSLFSSTNPPPKKWDKWKAENAFKGFVSKTGIRIAIDDKAQTITLLTSDKQSIVLDEKNKLIEIVDLNKNKLTLNNKGVQLEVKDKLSIEAKGDIEMKGKNIKLDASGKFEIKGSKVDIK